jgi:hypothetical protein
LQKAEQLITQLAHNVSSLRAAESRPLGWCDCYKQNSCPSEFTTGGHATKKQIGTLGCKSGFFMINLGVWKIPAAAGFEIAKEAAHWEQSDPAPLTCCRPCFTAEKLD